MKKIAFLVDDISRMGGAEKVVCNMANALVEYYEVEIISMVNRFGNIPYDLDEIIHCTFLLGDEECRIRKIFLKTRKKIRAILKQKNIEILLCIGIVSGMIGSIHAKDLKTKVFFCDHSSVSNQLENRQLTLGRKIASRFANNTIVLTKQSLEEYIKLFKTPRKKLIQIYDWIDDKVFEFAKPYDTESNKIISVGRIAKEKGFDMLVEIAKELKKLNTNWQWEIYGDGPEFNVIHEKIKQYRLENYVFLKGQENFIYDKYGGHAMLVLPSYREGQSLVLLEAQVNHLPVLSFDIVTGPAEIISHNENGFLIEAYNIQEMAERINELLRNKELRLNFSQNSYQNIDKFEKEKILKQWIELIRRIELEYKMKKRSNKMNLINKLKEKNNLPIIFFIILLINFLPAFMGNAFSKEDSEINSLLKIFYFLIEISILIFFYLNNRKSLKINKNKIIVLIIMCFIMFGVQVKNFIQQDFYRKDILNIAIFFANIFLFYIALDEFKIDEKSLIHFWKAMIYFSIFAIVWNLVLFNKEILAEFGIILDYVDYSYLDNPKSFFTNRNTLAFFIFLAIVCDSILINLENDKPKYKVIFFILWFGVWCSHSKTAYMITVIFAEIYILLENKYNLKKKIIICSCIGVLSILGFLNIMGYMPKSIREYEQLNELVVSKDRAKRLSGRKAIWNSCIDFLNKSPENWVFGVGKFNSRKALMVNEKKYFHCHNLYLEFIITGGMIELIYIGFIFYTIIKKILESDLKPNFKKIYSIMYVLYYLYCILESYGKISIGFDDTLCLIFFVSMPLLHANSIKLANHTENKKEEEKNEEYTNCEFNKK